MSSAELLADFARKVEPTRDWAELELPADAHAQLRELSVRAAHRATSVLFVGPSGSGKCLSAAIIAKQLGRPLYVVDLGAVVGKYLGETEKNLGLVFGAAESINAVLLFDEAEALFGKRTEVADAHDRYENPELTHLLLRIEQFKGLVILASNWHARVDDELIRRFAYAVRFPKRSADG